MLILKRCIKMFSPPKPAKRIINPSDNAKLIFFFELILLSLLLIIILLKMLEILIHPDRNDIDITVDSILVL